VPVTARLRPRLTEHGLEPVPGLPEPLPPGEILLWQGSPKWTAIAERVLLLRWVLAYFALLIGWEILSTVMTGAELLPALAAALLLFSGGMAAVAIIAIIAKFIATTSIYTITTKRIVLRVGVALPITINIPFAVIDGASLMQRKNGAGEIMLHLSPSHRISWIALWPHCCGWRLGRPKPTLRGIANVVAVSEILGSAVAGAAGGAVIRNTPSAEAAPPSSIAAMA